MTNRFHSALITGGAGYLGSHTTDRLLADGYTVRVLDLPGANYEQNLHSSLNDPKLVVEQRDILSLAAEDPLFADIDVIFHCAGPGDHLSSMRTPEPFINSNVAAFIRVLDAARHHGVKKIVYPSSAAIYAPADSPIRETHTIEPSNPYGLSKWLGEQIARHWHKLFKAPTLSFRIFNSYGPRATTAGVVGIYVKKKLAGEPITITGEGSQRRDFIYVSDVIDAFVRGVESNAVGEVYNLATGNARTVKELAHLIGGNIEFIPARYGEPPIICADISKIRADLHWSPQVPLEEGIRRLLNNLL